MVTQQQRKGDQYFNIHRYEEAARHYMQMIDASQKLGIYRNIGTEAAVRRKTANCFEMTGDYESALLHVREAMLLDSVENNIINLIEDYRQEGRIFIYMGSYNKGIVSLSKALNLAGSLKGSLKDDRKLAMADTYLALGQLYAATGKYKDALNYSDLAAGIFRQTGDTRGEMEAYLNTGSVWADLGDHQTALGYINRSLEIAVAGKMGVYRHHQLIASILTSSGRYDEAISSQEKALADARKYGIRGQIVWATIGLGDIYSNLGDNARAELHYIQAQKLKDTIPMQAGSLKASLDMRIGEVIEAGNYFSSEKLLTGDGISSMRLAEIMALKNEADSAVILLDRAGNAFRTAGNMQGLARVKVLKGKLLIDKYEYSEAGVVLDSALMWKVFPETTWQAYYYKGIMLETLNKTGEALESYKSAVRVIEDVRGNLTSEEFRSIFLDTKREVYERLISLLIRLGQTSEAFYYSENARARAFYEMLAGRNINFGRASADDLIITEQEKRNEIGKLQRLLQVTETPDHQNRAGTEDEPESLRRSLDRAREEYNSILQQIRTSKPEYAELIASKPASVDEIRKNLDEGSSAIAYWVSVENCYGWLISGNSVLCIPLGTGRDNLITMIEEARKAIRSLSPDAGVHLGRLYNLLIKPFENHIAGYGKLVIIPNGPLHFLPFQALTNNNGIPLVITHNIIYSPSAGVYIVSLDKEIAKGSKFLGTALADISIDDYPALPGTEDELRRIVSIFPDNQHRIGSSASETFVKENASSANILHFATHGIYNSNSPLNSHLLFPPSGADDGKLNVYEVFEMNLNASLVTLSACETGLGNLSLGDELTGLSRAFMYAGAGAVIVSLWPVADYPTAMLMSKFYSLVSEYPLQEALTLAQREIMKTYPQPLYWSPFILIGNGNIMAF